MCKATESEETWRGMCKATESVPIPYIHVLQLVEPLFIITKNRKLEVTQTSTFHSENNWKLQHCTVKLYYGEK